MQLSGRPPLCDQTDQIANESQENEGYRDGHVDREVEERMLARVRQTRGRRRVRARPWRTQRRREKDRRASALLFVCVRQDQAWMDSQTAIHARSAIAALSVKMRRDPIATTHVHVAAYMYVLYVLSY